MSTEDEKKVEAQKLFGQIEGLVKKAVQLGAGAYFSAEDIVNQAGRKALDTVQIPKGFLKQVVDEFIDQYTISVNAEIRIVPKKKVENEELK